MSHTTHSPFAILIDTREVHPWLFKDIPGMKGQGRIIVPCHWQSLGTGMGDYTIKGMEDAKTGWRISIERKSLPDLFSTILSNRARFVRELEKLNKMEYAAVVVEAPLEQVISYMPPYWRDMEIVPEKQMGKKRQVIGSIQAWQLRYGNIRWWFLSRSYVEIWCIGCWRDFGRIGWRESNDAL